MGFFERLKGMSDDSRERRRQSEIESRRYVEERRTNQRQQERDEERQREESLALGYETFKRLDVVKKMTEFQRRAKDVYGKAPSLTDNFLSGFTTSSDWKFVDQPSVGELSTRNSNLWINVRAGETTISWRDSLSDSGETAYGKVPLISFCVKYNNRELRVYGVEFHWFDRKMLAGDWTVEEFDKELLKHWPGQKTH